MARTISLGQIELTKLRNYRWEVAVGPEGHVAVTETYVVTDEGYTVAPEGKRAVLVVLTAAQQKSLNGLFRDALKKAAEREEVEAEGLGTAGDQ